ncbi:MAG: PAS domain-containing sensor histidine kinase [Thermoanaerobaculia bacterium]
MSPAQIPMVTTLLDRLPVAVVVVNDSGQIQFRNEAFAETFGGEGEQWLRSAARVVGGERGWLQRFFAADADDDSVDADFSGRTYRVDRIDISRGESPAVALTFEDVTREREMEQAKSDFTSMIVHDLRGPLSGIQGTLEFVLGQTPSRLDQMQDELLREASRESERMMSLINELLDFSKIESGNFVVEKEPVRLAGILKRSVMSMQSVATRDDIFLLSAHPSELPPFSGSIEKLTQVVINLVSNALKFTPKQGVISVGAQVVRDEEGPNAIVVTVTDSGIGIKPDQVAQLFQKYKQTKNKSLRGGGGTGLGLYIVKQVVEAHGGEVAVTSIEGVGTSMVLLFPIRRVVAA